MYLAQAAAFFLGFRGCMFYLPAAWCAADNRAFARLRTDVSCPQDSRVQIDYLVGKLLPRSGHFADAIAHFREAMSRLTGKHAYMAGRLIKLCGIGRVEPVYFEHEGG
jgi:hypothetical protein